MAKSSKQITRTFQSVTKTAIGQKQSLDAVLTVILGGLSNICYARAFFPQDAFVKQYYGHDKTIQTFEDYAAGKLTKDKLRVESPATKMMLLIPGRRKRVDKLLHFLNGIFTAVRNCELRALQFCVHADPVDRERVIEMYTFTIDYIRDQEDGLRPSTIEMDGTGSKPVTVGATVSAISQLLRKLTELCKPLPDLPEERFMSINLQYNEESESAKLPKGFTEGSPDNLRFVTADGWERETASLQSLSSGFHQAAVKVSHLQQIPERATSAFSSKPQFPSTTSYGPPFPQVSDIHNFITDDTTNTEDLLHEPQSRASSNATSVNEKNRPINYESSSKPPLHQPNVDAHASASNPTARSSSRIDDSQNTQWSIVFGQAEEFKGMKVHPDTLTQGDTQTLDRGEFSGLYSDTPTQNDTQTRDVVSFGQHRSVVLEDPSFGDSLGDSSQLIGVLPTETSRPCLSQAVSKRLAKEKLTNQRLVRRPSNDEGEESTIAVRCQCGVSMQEGDEVFCAYCKTWQHLWCYGYNGYTDPRLPTEHVCYQCLLGNNGAAMLAFLRDLARRRRAMCLAGDDGFRTQADFETKTGFEKGIARHVFQYLKDYGFVVAPNIAPSTRKSSSNNVSFVAVQSGPDYDKMMSELFDPMTHISHFYKLPANPETQHTSPPPRPPRPQANNMPPPPTPTSHLKDNRSETPSSGLDLPDSATPFRTPSRQCKESARSSLHHQPGQNVSERPLTRSQSASASKRLPPIYSEEQNTTSRRKGKEPTSAKSSSRTSKASANSSKTAKASSTRARQSSQVKPSKRRSSELESDEGPPEHQHTPSPKIKRLRIAQTESTINLGTAPSPA